MLSVLDWNINYKSVLTSTRDVYPLLIEIARHMISPIPPGMLEYSGVCKLRVPPM